MHQIKGSYAQDRFQFAHFGLGKSNDFSASHFSN